MSSPRLNEERSGKREKRQEWNPADTHVCVFLFTLQECIL